jgi:hypothetical protein
VLTEDGVHGFGTFGDDRLELVPEAYSKASA